LRSKMPACLSPERQSKPPSASLYRERIIYSN